jgi:hypothetical protein
MSNQGNAMRHLPAGRHKVNFHEIAESVLELLVIEKMVDLVGIEPTTSSMPWK